MTNHQQLHDDIDTDAIVLQVLADHRADLIVHQQPRATITSEARHKLDGLAATIAQHTGVDEVDLYDELDQALCSYLRTISHARKQLHERLHNTATKAAGRNAERRNAA